MLIFVVKLINKVDIYLYKENTFFEFAPWTRLNEKPNGKVTVEEVSSVATWFGVLAKLEAVIVV